MLEFELERGYGAFRLQIAARLGAEWLVLLAPSGAGKSLTLNLITGIERPERGFVRLDGETLFDAARRINRPIRRRRIGYLFQDYALFPHLTVAGNVAYGLPPGRDRAAEVARWLRFFQLEGRERAYPRHLSGGQRQRVALARTLAGEPRALLLDEPFSALDRRIRGTLQREMLALKERLNLPVVLVTHDFAEAELLGDRIAVMEQGRVLEQGDKATVFGRPRRHETARFLGMANVLQATVRSREAGGLMRVALGALTLRVPADDRFSPGDAVWLCVNGPDVRLKIAGGERPNAFGAVIRAIHAEQGMNRLLLTVDEGRAPELAMVVDDYVLQRYGLAPGRSIEAWLPPDKLILCE